MMYNQKLVASLKANGKILREFKDTVYIPFGSEYSIVLKNLNTVRAIVNITLDGTDVCPGGLVIMPAQTIDLERWIKNGNLSEGNRFKFIERTAQIEAHKGIGLEDGIISISYQFEHPPVQYTPATTIWNHTTNNWHQGGLRQDGFITKGLGSNIAQHIDNGPQYSSGTLRSMSVFASGASTTNASLNNVQVTAQAANYNDAGITVPGSKSDQKFAQASWFPVLPEKHSIVLKLLGETPDNKPVLQPVTVKAKPKCTTCGHTNKATNKFCSKCGTSLEIFA